MKGCGPKGTRCSRRGDCLVECENHAVAAGSFWWWGIYCIPGWRKRWTLLNGEYVKVADAQAMKAGVVSRREAQRINRQLSEGR